MFYLYILPYSIFINISYLTYKCGYPRYENELRTLYMTKIIVNTIKQSQTDCQYSALTDALSAYCLAFNLQIDHRELIIKGSSADARLKNGDKIECVEVDDCVIVVRDTVQKSIRYCLRRTVNGWEVTEL